MSTAASSLRTDWRQEWFEFEDTAYLNVAGNSPMPKASLRAAQGALEWKKFPQRMLDTSYFELPDRIRVSLARLIGAQPEEIALTTGASSGIAAVAYGLTWKPGDEIVTAQGEFPLQYTTWSPMQERDGVKVKIIAPRERFITAEDLAMALSPKTRLVSVSLVRFDDGSLLDAARVAEACHRQGTLLLLDVSQCCGAIPLDVKKLDADFLICAGYKWLLGPYGTGFLWVKHEHIARMRPGPFYWMAAQGAHNFSSQVFKEPKPSAGARRWDSAETASHFNLAAMEASLDFVLRLSPDAVLAHNHNLIEMMYEHLPKDRCFPTSPLDATRRGPYGCFAARSQEKTVILYQRLQEKNVIVSLRAGNLRISPHVFNTERDIDRLISVITT